jgi:hypothetical protein
MRSAVAPLTSLGEDALRRLVTRYEDFRLLDEGAPAHSWPGRHRSGQGVDVRLANALVDIVAVCENFATARILQTCAGLSDQDVFNWNKRKKAWWDELSVDFEQAGADWAQVEGFIEVRNALQHGLGRLTDAQLAKRRDAILAAIRSAEIELNGDRVVLRASDVARCVDACIGFTLYLDRSAPAN